MANCYFCGSELSGFDKIYKSTQCKVCNGDIKICVNCRFYDQGSHWDCKETIDELVVDKYKANFCDYFSLGDYKHPGIMEKRKQAKNKFESLFND